MSPGSGNAVDVTAFKGGFIAIGSVWPSEFHVEAETAAIWTSVDGRDWTRVTVDLGVEDVTLVNIVVRADGRLLLAGRTPGSYSANAATAAAVAWVSDDGLTWTTIDFPTRADAHLYRLDHGPKGYVMAADEQVWFSPDGIGWAVTYEGMLDVVAGDEGFVASNSVSGEPSLVASADGIEWFEGGPSADGLFEVAPMGGDWIATKGSPDPPTTTVWHSANGLDWAEGIDVNELTGPDGPKTGGGLLEPNIGTIETAGGAGIAMLNLGDIHCCAQMGWSYGAWSSSDGVTWKQTIGSDAHPSAVASAGDVTVAVGHLGRGSRPAFWIATRVPTDD